jgi:hypothetical protein
VLDGLHQFEWIESQTTRQDRLALLSIKEAVAGTSGAYQYLEVGSHLGGSLQPHIADRRCTRIFSIDPRPAEQPDERWSTTYQYPGNSTARMLENLARVPGADLTKLQTFECSSWELRPSDLGSLVDVGFIDGEHTDAAVTKDFQAVRGFIKPQAVIAFHDCGVVLGPILRARRKTPGWWVHYPDSSVIAVAFGDSLGSRLRAAGWTEQLPVPRFYRLRRAAARLARARRPEAPIE